MPAERDRDRDLILDVRKVSRDGGSYCVKCPHCGEVIYVEGEDLSEIRGEQYKHARRERPGVHGMTSSGCDGWMQVHHDAVFVRELVTEESHRG